MGYKKQLTTKQHDNLIATLKSRFEKNMNLHKGIEWVTVLAKLEKFWSIFEIERTAGEPDVEGYDKKTNEFIFYDCSRESPEGRRRICYAREGLNSRKDFKPENNAVDMLKPWA